MTQPSGKSQDGRAAKASGKRRDNRVAAVQFLYMWDANRPADLERELRRFFEKQEPDEGGGLEAGLRDEGPRTPEEGVPVGHYAGEVPREHFAFAEELVRGAVARMDEIDGVIRRLAENWEFDRIAKMDLAILRLAIHEMGGRKDIPPVVSINEAIELGKAFSAPESRRFINGILDRYKLELSRPARTAGE